MESNRIRSLSSVVPPPDESRHTQDLTKAQAASDLGVALDPEVTRGILSSIGTFTTNFCYPPDSPQGVSACRQTVLDDSVVEREVKEFLIRAKSGRSPILSVAASFAKIIGKSIAM